MTLEQFNTLRQYEESFQEAQSNYYRAILMSDLNVMNDIWTDLGHERASLTCGKCVLIFLQQLGKDYYEFKKQLETPVQENIKTNSKKNAKKKQ